MDSPRNTLAHDLRVREVARLEKASNNVSSDILIRKDQLEELEVFKCSLKIVFGHLVKLYGCRVRLFCCTRIRRRYCAVRIGSEG